MSKGYEVITDLQIDLDRLDDEWAEQPNSRYEAGVRLADARREWSMATAALGVAESEAAQDIRRSPESFGLVKLTEAAVKELVPLQELVKDAVQTMIDARHRMDKLDSEVQGSDHRKKALEKEVDLFLAGYFSKPKASSVSREHVVDMEMKMQAARRNRKSPREKTK